MLKRAKTVLHLSKLLVVIAIIGILAAIAIPQFAAYKRSANDGAAKSQLRNIAASMEGYYVANTNYGDALGAGGTVNEIGLAIYGYRNNPTVTLTIPSAAAPICVDEGNSCWSADAVATNGTPGIIWTWDSNGGGAQW